MTTELFALFGVQISLFQMRKSILTLRSHKFFLAKIIALIKPFF